MTDLLDLNSNQIINSLDILLAKGHKINDIVSALDNVLIIANYSLLVEKGATNIDLAAIRDGLDPIVVMNNLEVFQRANVPVDMVKTVYGLLDDDTFSMSPYDVSSWLELGADPQVLSDKYAHSEGVNLEAIQALLDAGAHIDADKIIENLLNGPDYLLENFYAENDVPILKRAGANPEAINKLQKHISELTIADEHATYGGPYPQQLDINEAGKQAKKIFFQPQIQIVSPNGGRELQVDWAGRILPGQTLQEGIGAELKKVYNYSGRFEFRNPYFLDYAKDSKGNNIQRYGIYITLFPADEGSTANDHTELKTILEANFSIKDVNWGEVEDFDATNMRTIHEDKTETVSNKGHFTIFNLSDSNEDWYKLVKYDDNFKDDGRLVAFMKDAEYNTVKDYELIEPTSPIQGYTLYKLTPYTAEDEPQW